MTREEVEKIMGDEPKIQASFEVIGDDVKFIKIIVNGKEKVVNIEELITTYTEPCRETDDYENEIEGLQNRLDIAEYDKERLREEVTVLEEKLKALYTEPCDCISRKEVMKALCNNCELCKDGVQTCFSKCEEYHFLVTLPSIQPKTDVLDKIRAELHATAEMHEDGDYYLRDEWIDEIIDKYTAESEDK